MNLQVNKLYQDLVPEMSTEEYKSFKRDIKENGLRIPITVNQEGVILDGHHRFRACKELGIECTFDTPKIFISLKRRIM